MNSSRKYYNDYSPLLEQLINVNKAKTVVEIGVNGGHTTLALCRGSQKFGGRLYGFDIWGSHGLADEYPVHGYTKTQVEEFLLSNGYNNFDLTCINSKDITFKNILKEKTDGCIDLAFIDGCHSYTGILNDVQAVYPLLSKTGVIVFHDTFMIDGCREVMADLRSIYFDGTFDIVDFFGACGDFNCGVSLLVKRQYPILEDNLKIMSGAVSDTTEILEKERAWLRDEIIKYSSNQRIVDIDINAIKLKNIAAGGTDDWFKMFRNTEPPKDGTECE